MDVEQCNLVLYKVIYTASTVNVLNHINARNIRTFLDKPINFLEVYMYKVAMAASEEKLDKVTFVIKMNTPCLQIVLIKQLGLHVSIAIWNVSEQHVYKQEP